MRPLYNIFTWGGLVFDASLVCGEAGKMGIYLFTANLKATLQDNELRFT